MSTMSGLLGRSGNDWRGEEEREEGGRERGGGNYIHVQVVTKLELVSILCPETTYCTKKLSRSVFIYPLKLWICMQ